MNAREAFAQVERVALVADLRQFLKQHVSAGYRVVRLGEEPVFVDDVRKAAKTFAIDEPIVNIGLNNAPTQHHPTLKNGLVQAANNFAVEEVLPEGYNAS